MPPGRLITIEGIDGAGKSTLAESLADELRRRGIEAHLLREPGGVSAAERIRELVKDPSLRIDARAEALLYAAARAQLVDEALAPLLASGEWVLLDRFVDSSLAYQGAGRGLGVDAIRAVNQFATGGVAPDRTLLLDIDLAAGRRRAGGRGEAPDRLESERDDFFEAIRAAYLELWRENPWIIRRIDASGQPDEVLAAALAELSDLL
jgi:dTMP kinase